MPTSGHAAPDEEQSPLLNTKEIRLGTPVPVGTKGTGNTGTSTGTCTGTDSGQPTKDPDDAEPRASKGADMGTSSDAATKERNPMPEFMTDEMRETISDTRLTDENLARIRKYLQDSETACDDQHQFNPGGGC